MLHCRPQHQQMYACADGEQKYALSRTAFAEFWRWAVAKMPVLIMAAVNGGLLCVPCFLSQVGLWHWVRKEAQARCNENDLHTILPVFGFSWLSLCVPSSIIKLSCLFLGRDGSTQIWGLDDGGERLMDMLLTYGTHIVRESLFYLEN